MIESLRNENNKKQKNIAAILQSSNNDNIILEIPNTKWVHKFSGLI